MSGGTKHDGEKPRMDLIPAEAEIEEAYVWGYGAFKYAEHNFRKGIPFSKIIAAAKRHINAIQSGEDMDWDFDGCQGCRDSRENGKWTCKMHSGRKHWANVRCCMGMLAVMEIEHPELDDRYRRTNSVPSTSEQLLHVEGYKAIQESIERMRKLGKVAAWMNIYPVGAHTLHFDLADANSPLLAHRVECFELMLHGISDFTAIPIHKKAQEVPV